MAFCWRSCSIGGLGCKGLGTEVAQSAADTAGVDASERSFFTAAQDDLLLPTPEKRDAVQGTVADVPDGDDRSSKYLPALPRWKTLLSKLDGRAALRDAIGVEIDRGAPFLLVPVLLAGGAIAYFTASAEPLPYTLPASAAVLAILAVASRSRRWLQTTLAAILIVVLGALLAQVETWRAGTKVLGSEISTRLTGRVVLMEHQASGRVRLTIDVIATERPVLRYAPDRIRASARKVPPDIVAGSEISGIVRLRPPTGPVRPDSYDFSFESYFDGIGANGFFLKGPELVELPAAPLPHARFSSAVENARSTLAGHIRDRIGGVEGEIAAALVVGVRAGIPEEVNEALRRTGLAHILSISGLHMALVAATIMGTLRAGFALFPDFASRRPVKKYAAAFALFAIAAYLFISGGEVAAQRSFIMLAVMLSALLFDRAALTMRNLAIAAIAVIIWSPHEVAGPSFQMSFAATAALIGAYAAWSERRAGRFPATPSKGTSATGLARKIAYYAAGLAMTSLIAGAATTLYGIYHFQRVSPLSLAANLAAMPVVSAVVMPSAVLGMVAMPFGLDGPIFDVMGRGLAAMIAIAEWFSERSPVDAVGIVPPGAVIVLTIALVIATLATTWLRIAAVPLLIAGLIWISARETPDVLISEDGKLVAMPFGDGELAVNGSRPSSFTVENWQRVLQTETLRKPANQLLDAEAVLSGNTEKPFLCDGGLCLARHRSGVVVAHAENAAVASLACRSARLIVIDDATAGNPCTENGVTVITKRDLARKGSAEVFLPAENGVAIAVADFAISEPYRPWHTQRRFSREARGIAPYRREARATTATDGSRQTDLGNPPAPSLKTQ